jgi:hypothetical protein
MSRALMTRCLFAALFGVAGCSSAKKSEEAPRKPIAEMPAPPEKAAGDSPEMPMAVPVNPVEEMPPPPPAPPESESAEPIRPNGKKGIEQTLRTYFSHLALKEPEKAHAMMLLSMDTCMTIFSEKSNCEAVVKGQRDAIEALKKDPIPFNSKLMDIRVGAAQVINKDRGGIANRPIWIGSQLMGRAPGGHDFLLRSLAVIETPTNHWVLWGTRRGLKDTPRNSQPDAASKAPEDPKAP